MSSTPKLLEDSLLLVWNNRNSAERLNVMKEVYSPAIEFFESDNGEAIVGFEAINSLIEKLQSNWLPEFAFTLLKPAKVNHNIQQISWTLGSPGQQAVARGMDIAILDNGNIKALYLFLETENE